MQAAVWSPVSVVDASCLVLTLLLAYCAFNAMSHKGLQLCPGAARPAGGKPVLPLQCVFPLHEQGCAVVPAGTALVS